MQTNQCIKGLLGLALGLSASMGQAAELYRWADENGKVHYTDRIPAKYIEQGYRIISKQGLTIHTIKAVADEPKIEVEPTAPLLSEEQKKRDRTLLMSYGSEQEISETHARKIEELQALIVFNEENSRMLENQFRDLTRQAGDYEKQGKEVPDPLLTKINATNQKIRAFFFSNTQRTKEVTAATQQYEKDISRYQALQKNDGEIGPEIGIIDMFITEETPDLNQQVTNLEVAIAKQNQAMSELEGRFKLIFSEIQHYQKSGQQAPPELSEEIALLKLKIQQSYVHTLQSNSQLQGLREQLDSQ